MSSQGRNRAAPASPVSPDGRSVEVHIEEIVLHGIDREPSAIGDVVQHELARLIGEHGLPSAAAPGSEDEDGRLDDATFAVREDATARTIGTHIAQRVYRRLTARR